VASLQELLAQKELLEREIESTKKQARTEAIGKIRTLMSEYGVTVADLGTRTGGKTSVRAGGKVAVKYRNAVTGDTWSGRGLQPKWLRAALASGRSIDEFSV
jgi:DNA-binding protein H-NS